MTLKQLQDNKELHEAARSFLMALVAAKLRFIRERDNILQGKEPFRVASGGEGVAATPELDEAERLLAKRCFGMKALGSRRVNESDVLSVAWSCASTVPVIEPIDESASTTFVNTFVKELWDAAATACVCFIPNYGCILETDVRSVDIGPVQIRRTEDVVQEITGTGEWKTHVEKSAVELSMTHAAVSSMLTDDVLAQVKGGAILAPEGLLEVEPATGRGRKARAVLRLRLPAHCWRVSVKSTRTNAREQALWLTDIAMTLMRLSYPTGGHYPPPPACGVHEVCPGFSDEVPEASITLAGNEAFPRGRYSKARYVISAELVKVFKDAGLSAKMDAIAQAHPDAVGRRLAQGLGWLARGRQVDSQPERFLFFFTAVEALLYADDRNTPVTQTISRHAGTILSDDPKTRAIIAKEFSNLYNIRSQLVHGGEREVSTSHAERIQVLAEELYRIMLQKAKLETKLKDFVQQLRDASFGFPWAP